MVFYCQDSVANKVISDRQIFGILLWFSAEIPAQLLHVVGLLHSYHRLSFMPVCGSLTLIGHQLAFMVCLLFPTWNESSQRLVLFVSIPVSLPPVGVVLADNMKDVSLLKRQSELSTRQERVIGGVVVEVSSHVHLRTDMPLLPSHRWSCMQTERYPQACNNHQWGTYHSLSVWGRFNLWARDQEEGQRTMHLLLLEKKAREDSCCISFFFGSFTLLKYLIGSSLCL